MSRSSFAARFKELTGVAPLDYVTSWRMHKAKSLLKQGNVAISDVANLVGTRRKPHLVKLSNGRLGHRRDCRGRRVWGDYEGLKHGI